MIAFIEAQMAGNAVRLILEPPPGALYSTVLRRTDQNFAGVTDPGAVVVVSQVTNPNVMDITGLTNGTTYYYLDYTYDGSAWTAGTIASCVPACSYIGSQIDPQVLVRDRVRLGLAAEVAAGNLKPASGAVQVLTAPFAMQDGVSFPVVSVHLESYAPADRAVGEMTFAEPPDSLIASDGWLASTRLSIIGVSLNPDERIALRRALHRVILANLAIFDQAGLLLIEFSQTDSENFEGNNAPLYYTNGSFGCVAPSFVYDVGTAITQINVNPVFESISV